jgi:hypothetical protein
MLQTIWSATNSMKPRHQALAPVLTATCVICALILHHDMTLGYCTSHNRVNPIVDITQNSYMLSDDHADHNKAALHTAMLPLRQACCPCGKHDRQKL